MLTVRTATAVARCIAFLTTFCLLLAVVTVMPTRADGFRAIDQLPDRTVVYLRIRNTVDLVEKLKQTAVGAALQDPQVSPLVRQMWGSLATFLDQFEADAGVGVDQLYASLPGEMIIAGVDVPAFPLAWAVMFQVDDDHPLMKTMEVGEQRLKEAGYGAANEAIDGIRARIFSNPTGPIEEVIQLKLGDWHVITTSRRVAAVMIALRARTEKDTLADYSPFRTVIARCDPRDSSDVQWYVDPINLAKSLTRGNFAASAGLALLPAIGADSIEAIGGSVAVADGQYDLIARTQLVIDPPRDGILEVAAVGDGFTDPETWVPADAANYVTWHLKTNEMYATAKKLADSFRGEGATKRFVDRRFTETIGADFETELLPALTGRVTRIEFFEKPISLQSQSSAVGIEIADPNAFLPTFDKITSKWSERIRRESFAGTTYYQWVSDDQTQQDTTEDAASEQAELSPRERRRRAWREQRRNAAPVAMLLGNYLIVADRLSTAERLIMTLNDAEARLRDELEFKLVASKLKRFSSDAPGMLRFDRPEKGLEVLYGLLQDENIREQIQGQRDQNPLAATIDDLLKEDRFPAFSVIAQYFAPGGSALFNEQTGFHHVLFTLQRQRPESGVISSGPK
jgi:hypothetical protein